jgi:uracil-DNA glycosylase
MSRAPPSDRREPFPPAQDFFPRELTLSTLRAAARDCRACPLYARATQTVFGEGPEHARVVLIGEQPGDAEDRAGHPFVGPAGRILDDALREAGLERGTLYVTNAVKHFSFEERGKSRIHKRPKPGEVRACSPWLETELRSIRPDVVVLLGATAAQALLGPSFRVTKERGKPLPSEFARVMIATAHPSSILRAPDSAARASAFRELVSDLRVVVSELDKKRD